MWVRQFNPENDDTWSGMPGVPDLVFLFATTRTLSEAAWISKVHERFASSTLVGCSSGTMVKGDTIDDEESVGVAIGFANTRLKIAKKRISEGQGDKLNGAGLGSTLYDPELSAIILLSDGLAGNASALINGLREAVGEDVAISGGLAGDGARFERTVVLVDGQVTIDTVVAIGLYGPSLRISHGSEGGWEPFGPTRRITSTRGTALLELDGAPALELYERYLGEEAAELPASGLLFPLEIWDPKAPETKIVRTLVGIDREAGALIFAGDIPSGWDARLMHGTVEGLVSGASRAADAAVSDLGDVDGDTLCLLVSCVGRRLMMGQRAEEDVEEVASRLPAGTVISGFFSYGEVAPHHATRKTCLHNQTMTLTMLGEAA